MLNNQFFITEEKINEYLSYLVNEECTTTTIEKYSRDIKVFADFLNGSEATKERVISWKNTLKESHEATSVNSIISEINGFFAFFKLDTKVKQFKIQQKTFLPTEKELTTEEYEKLLKTAWTQGNERLCFLMQTICSTGIRVSELKFITVETLKKGYAEIHNKGKIRTILLPDDLVKTLLSYLKKYGTNPVLSLSQKQVNHLTAQIFGQK